MVAIGLIFGKLEASHYEDSVAADPRIDALREKMEVYEDERYSKDYMDPDKRSIANAIQVKFKDGTSTEKVEVEYPIGHRRRRGEGIPVLLKKFDAAVSAYYSAEQAENILSICGDYEQLKTMPVTSFLEALAVTIHDQKLTGSWYGARMTQMVNLKFQICRGLLPWLFRVGF